MTQKKDVRFVQTREEMAKELFARGLKDTGLAVLPVEGRTARTLTGDALANLIPLLYEIEAALVILERRGHTLESFLPEGDEAGRCRCSTSGSGRRSYFFHTQEEVEAFRAGESQRLGQELVVADECWRRRGDGRQADRARPTSGYRFTVDEWHEVRALNRALAKLREIGFEPGDLVPLPRVAGREPPVRFAARARRRAARSWTTCGSWSPRSASSARRG